MPEQLCCSAYTLLIYDLPWGKFCLPKISDHARYLAFNNLIYERFVTPSLRHLYCLLSLYLHDLLQICIRMGLGPKDYLSILFPRPRAAY